MSDNGATPEVIQPSPLPQTVQIFGGRAEDGQSIVQLIFHTPQGSSFFFLDERSATWLRDKLTENVGGIVIPQTGIAPSSRYTPPQGHG